MFNRQRSVTRLTTQEYGFGLEFLQKESHTAHTDNRWKSRETDRDAHWQSVGPLSSREWPCLSRDSGHSIWKKNLRSGAYLARDPSLDQIGLSSESWPRYDQRPWKIRMFSFWHFDMERRGVLWPCIPTLLNSRWWFAFQGALPLPFASDAQYWPSGRGAYKVLESFLHS